MDLSEVRQPFHVIGCSGGRRMAHRVLTGTRFTEIECMDGLKRSEEFRMFVKSEVPVRQQSFMVKGFLLVNQSMQPR